MTLEEIRARLALLNCPEARGDSMVAQVWEDGEVTLTKGGDLLGQRSLHMIEGPHTDKLPAVLFPNRNSGGHGWVWCHYSHARAVREEVIRMTDGEVT